MTMSMFSVVSERFSQLRKIPTWIPELDRVLGGGFAEGGVTLVVGPPGAGKTTLLLQAGASNPTTFVSAEETHASLSAQAKRVGADSPQLSIWGDLGNVSWAVRAAKKSKLLIVDTLQTAYVNFELTNKIEMIDAVVRSLVREARKRALAIVLVSHVNRGGQVLGSQNATHFVDAVMRLDFMQTPGLEHLRMLSIAETNRDRLASPRAVLEMTVQGFRMPKEPYEHITKLVARS